MPSLRNHFILDTIKGREFFIFLWVIYKRYGYRYLCVFYDLFKPVKRQGLWKFFFLPVLCVCVCGWVGGGGGGVNLIFPITYVDIGFCFVCFYPVMSNITSIALRAETCVFPIVSKGVYFRSVLNHYHYSQFFYIYISQVPEYGYLYSCQIKQISIRKHSLYSK